MSEWICPICGFRFVIGTLDGADRMRRHQELGCAAPAKPAPPIMYPVNPASKPAGTMGKKCQPRRKGTNGF